MHVQEETEIGILACLICVPYFVLFDVLDALLLCRFSNGSYLFHCGILRIGIFRNERSHFVNWRPLMNVTQSEQPPVGYFPEYSQVVR